MGRIDAQVTFKLEEMPRLPILGQLGGPFRHRKDASLPDYDIEIGARDYGTKLTSVGGRSYVSLGSTGYPLPAAVRRASRGPRRRGATG